MPEVNVQTIESIIQSFIAESPLNTLGNVPAEKAFDAPLVGFANGADPLFEAYREHVGPFHMTPLEAFAAVFGDTDITADDLSVVSYILPQTKATKKDNRREAFYPSERWARARYFGEKANNALRKHIVRELHDRGIPAVAPLLTPQFYRRVSPVHGLASTWSERHMAYAAGLGTFGLCDGLITPLGKAMRTGSVVARIRIPPSPRPYTDHHAYCLYFSKGTCKKCTARCPAGAITESGKDKSICAAYLHPGTDDYVREEFGFNGHGCGLCQTKVPCESRIPGK